MREKEKGGKECNSSAMVGMRKYIISGLKKGKKKEELLQLGKDGEFETLEDDKRKTLLGRERELGREG